MTPKWYRFAWFLGRAPDLTQRQWRVLGLVAAVSFFETYDLYLFSLNLKQIQADLAIPESELGFLGSLVRAGALLSIPLAMFADRVGRRRMLLITIVGYTVLTGATAFSPNAETFVVLQFLARAFAVAETILATVVIVEEFGPEHRGWGVGAAGAIQACGAGLASLLFGFVEVLPYGWRALYMIGLVPLIFLTYWRRTLPETHRFLEQTEQMEKTVAARELLYGIAHLMRRYPKRLWALSATVFVTSIAVSAGGFFAPKYLQDVHGWSPTDVALMSFFGGMFAIMGNPLAGWMSDRRGRRPVTAAFALGLGVVTIALYNSSGIVLPGLWVALVFFSLGTNVTESTYSAEMFPTKQRSTAASLKSLMSTVGAISGLALISVLFGMFESNWTAISVLACLCFGVPVIVLTLLPETARARLEDIAPDTP